MSVTTPQEQPAATGQDPASIAPAPVAPAPVAAGPWAADLEQIISDPAMRGTVDQFLRTKVQPHTTRLEQEVASSRDAVRLWQELEKDPVGTYVAITSELFGQEAGQQLLGQIQQMQSQQPPAAQSGPQPTVFDPKADPQIAAALQYIEDQQASKYYDGEMARIKAMYPDVNTELLHPFVSAAEGKFDEAVQLYRNWMAQAAPAAPQAPTPQAPAVLGSDTTAAAASTTPVEPKRQTLDEALNEFMAEQRASRDAPPVIG